MAHLVQSLEILVARYEKAAAELTAINEELRTLPPTSRLAELVALNERTLATR